MEKGISLSTKSIIKSFDEETKLEIKKMQEEIKNYSLQVPNFNDNITNLSLTEEQIYALKGYTGLNFKKINSLLRKIWNYEELGIKTELDEKKIQADIALIDEIISYFPESMEPFITYRGTTIDAFKQYNIESIEELNNLNGKFLYEEAYTSTSLDENKSYYNKNIYGTVTNIEIKYIVPPHFNDGIPLTTSNLSYSPNLQEYLIGRNALSKVIKVETKIKTAIITVILIPKKIWDKKEKNKEMIYKKSYI